MVIHRIVDNPVHILAYARAFDECGVRLVATYAWESKMEIIGQSKRIDEEAVEAAYIRVCNS